MDETYEGFTKGLKIDRKLPYVIVKGTLKFILLKTVRQILEPRTQNQKKKNRVEVILIVVLEYL